MSTIRTHRGIVAWAMIPLLVFGLDPEPRVRSPILAGHLTFEGVDVAAAPTRSESDLETAGASGWSGDTLSLKLNIAAFRLDVRDGTSIRKSIPVAVGMRSYPTPTGQFEISRIVWNPWWYPPDAEWAAHDSITPPGPANPMGKVKLLLNGPYYMHGTPLTSSIGRAASHGCIRMRNADAIDLAKRVQESGKAAASEAFTDSVIANWRMTRTVVLSAAVPMAVVYEVAEVRDSVLTIHPDVYRRVGAEIPTHAIQALVDAGYDTARIDRRALRDVVARGRSRTASVPVSDVLGRPTPGRGGTHTRDLAPDDSCGMQRSCAQRGKPR